MAAICKEQDESAAVHWFRYICHIRAAAWPHRRDEVADGSGIRDHVSADLYPCSTISVQIEGSEREKVQSSANSYDYPGSAIFSYHRVSASLVPGVHIREPYRSV
ncbi:protein of unknown function [Paenibacillus alvei]|uniref:Uncharacterized protein n=1 Tax=Paenibacillus alvei TaxID=44250 RepID=A0A383RJ90_PAEAL|nr:protein of unknown function [Paenibacillus alvei]